MTDTSLSATYSNLHIHINTLLDCVDTFDLKFVLDCHIPTASEQDIRISHPFSYERFPTKQCIDDPLIRTHFLNEHEPIHIDKPCDDSASYLSTTSKLIASLRAIIDIAQKHIDIQLSGYICEAIDPHTNNPIDRTSPSTIRRRAIERRWIIEVEQGYVYPMNEALKRPHVAFRNGQGMLTIRTSNRQQKRKRCK